MSDSSAAGRGRLLPFEPDRGKRYHFRKYVEGILLRGLSEAERQQCILRAANQRQKVESAPGRKERDLLEPTTMAKILPFQHPLYGWDRAVWEHCQEMAERRGQEQREQEQTSAGDGDAAAPGPLDNLNGESPASST
jgi:hypothetical protein